MANVTIAIDDELLQAARVKAVQQGTSVNEICRQAIEAFARPEEAALQGAQALLDALDKARAETRRVAAGTKRRTGSGSCVARARGALRRGDVRARTPARIAQTMKSFVDTNVFVYAAEGSDKEKAQRARQLIADLAARRQLVVSTQVLQELYTVLVKRHAFRPATALKVVEQLAEQQVHPSSAEFVLRALRLSGTRQISPWDALIVQAALDAGCRTLYTEDLKHGQRIAGPFDHQPVRRHAARRA